MQWKVRPRRRLRRTTARTGCTGSGATSPPGSTSTTTRSTRRLPGASLADEVARTRANQQGLWDAGWLRYGWPTSVGGLGGSPLLRAAAAEECARRGLFYDTVFAVGEVLAPPVIAAAPELAVEHITPFLRGAEGWCQGFSEPDAGSDLASLRCRAVDDGDHWVVTGQKIWTSYAQFASKIVLLARTGTPESRHRGITAMLVDMESPGVSVRPLHAINDIAEFSETFFDDVLRAEGPRHRRGERRLGRRDGDAALRAGWHLLDVVDLAARRAATPRGRERPRRRRRRGARSGVRVDRRRPGPDVDDAAPDGRGHHPDSRDVDRQDPDGHRRAGAVRSGARRCSAACSSSPTATRPRCCARHTCTRGPRRSTAAPPRSSGTSSPTSCSDCGAA